MHIYLFTSLLLWKHSSENIVLSIVFLKLKGQANEGRFHGAARKERWESPSNSLSWDGAILLPLSKPASPPAYFEEEVRQQNPFEGVGLPLDTFAMQDPIPKMPTVELERPSVCNADSLFTELRPIW